ncbi:MAG: DUF2007 domain-containing protein [Deltaproteobacteria bacterium]|nr:DUF2007 domain-containing protein [Deltaproteobacteria bacterium]
MKTVYSAQNIALVSLMKNILDGCGIECRIKNEFLSGAVGELPPIECWPQICVNDEKFPEASRIVEEALSSETDEMIGWKCKSCGEEIEGQFTECWSCGKSRSE